MSDENTIKKTEAENIKNQEITFDSFLDLIKSGIELGEGKAIQQVFQTVKKGFSGELNVDHVDVTFKLLKDWEFVDLLAVKLINEERNGKLTSFARRVTHRIRFNFIQEYKYPIPKDGANVSRDEIFGWIKTSFRSLPSEPVENSTSQTIVSGKTTSSQSLDKLLRIMFVCLSSNFKDEFILEAIDYLLTEYFDNRRKKFKISKNSYLNYINEALASKNPLVTIENILASSATFKEIAVKLRESENELWRKNQSLQVKIHQLENSEQSLRNQLRETTREKDDLNVQLSDKTRALEEWKAENKNLDHHWQELSKQKLTKQASDTKRKLQNEITEIKLILENHPPDVEIALLLLQRIERILGDSNFDEK